MKRRILMMTAAAALAFAASAQKIFLTGDSHVSAGIYPAEVKKIVESERPSASVSSWGKAGAGFYTFNDSPELTDHIFRADPDILIVHLGTNGCYTPPLDPEKYQNDIQTFYDNVRSRLPECKIVFVTPFYNRNRDVLSSSGKQKTYGPWKPNEKTRGVADILIEFVADKADTYVIDNNADAGTVFLDEPGLINADNIHLTPKGYQLLGRQVADRLLDIPDIWQ